MNILIMLTTALYTPTEGRSLTIENEIIKTIEKQGTYLNLTGGDSDGN